MKKIEKMYKTSQKMRNEYIYEFANGERTVIRPGENGVTEIDIQLNHSFDDEEVRAWNRDVYKTNHYIEDFESIVEPDCNSILMDIHSDPLNVLLEAESGETMNEIKNNLNDEMKNLTEKQLIVVQKSFFENKSNVEIAKEENVSEAAIRKRLKGALQTLKKELQKGS